MIPIEKESPDLIKEFRVYENCVFCKKQTDTWNVETNKPICNDCSVNHEIEEIPKKYC